MENQSLTVELLRALLDDLAIMQTYINSLPKPVQSDLYPIITTLTNTIEKHLK